LHPEIFKNRNDLPIILYECEIRTPRHGGRGRTLTSIEIKFFKRTAGYTLFDHKRNKNVLQEMKVEPDSEKLTTYKPHWLQVTRTAAGRQK
jgi:hypothetical protein